MNNGYFILETDEHGLNHADLKLFSEEETVDKICKFYRQFDEIEYYKGIKKEEILEMPYKLRIIEGHVLSGFGADESYINFKESQIKTITFKNFQEFANKLIAEKNVKFLRTGEIAKAILLSR